jgi:hypothetical protein
MSREQCGPKRVATRAGADGNRIFSRRRTGTNSQPRAQAARSPRQHRPVQPTWAIGARVAFELIDEIDRNDLDDRLQRHAHSIARCCECPPA